MKRLLLVLIILFLAISYSVGEPSVHFSIDDCILVFKDISKNPNKKSPVKASSLLKNLYKLHQREGVKVTLYCFCESDGFTLEQVPDVYSEWFGNNSDWLKFGYHGYNAEQTFRDSFVEDLNFFENQIIRITGTENSLAKIVRTHRFEGSVENLKAFGENYTFLSADNLDLHPTSYYLTEVQTKLLYDNEKLFEDYTGLNFITTDFRLENIKSIQEVLKKTINDHYIIFFTHEKELTNPKRKNWIKFLFNKLKIDNTYRKLKKILINCKDCEFL